MSAHSAEETDTHQPAKADTDTDSTSGTVANAKAIHDRGLRVFPADHPDQPNCIGKHGPENPCDGIRGKHPAVKWGTWAVAPTLG